MRSFTHYSAIKMCLIAVLTVNSKKNTFSLACFLGQMFELQHFLCRRFKILHWRQLFSNAEGFNSACRFLYFLLSICYVLPLPSFCHNLDCGDTNTAIYGHIISNNLFLLLAGEEGRLAYEQLDTVPGEMIRLGTRRGNTVTTAFWAITEKIKGLHPDLRGQHLPP